MIDLFRLIHILTSILPQKPTYFSGHIPDGLFQTTFLPASKPKPQPGRNHQHRAAPCDQGQRPPGSPEAGVTLSSSVPHISFIIINMISIQKLSKLLFKGHLLMMFFLVSDIGDNPFNFRRIDGKNSIAVLPIKIGICTALRFDPF